MNIKNSSQEIVQLIFKINFFVAEKFVDWEEDRLKAEKSLIRK
jgi:hypothetical protein